MRRRVSNILVFVSYTFRKSAGTDFIVRLEHNGSHTDILLLVIIFIAAARNIAMK